MLLLVSWEPVRAAPRYTPRFQLPPCTPYNNLLILVAVVLGSVEGGGGGVLLVVSGMGVDSDKLRVVGSEGEGVDSNVFLVVGGEGDGN
jgi:hypothetical protein